VVREVRVTSDEAVVRGSVRNAVGDAGEAVGSEVTQAAGRKRRYASPRRQQSVLVKYTEQERSAVGRAAEVAGLRVSSYVAVAALHAAQAMLGEGLLPPVGVPTAGLDGSVVGGPGRRVGLAWSAGELREVLAELVSARLALRRYGVNLNQAVVLLHTGGGVPVWLQQAVQAADRAVGRVDAASAVLVRRLP